MSITIYHNPRCSKSRKTLEILNSLQVRPNIVRYLENPPDARRILGIAEMLGQPVSALLRRNEKAFKEASDLPPLEDDAALAAWLQKNPSVIERPLVVNEQARTAVIGRPPENVHTVLGS